MRSIPIGSGLRPPNDHRFPGSIPFLLGPLSFLLLNLFFCVSLLVALLGLLFSSQFTDIVQYSPLNILSFFAYSSFKVSLTSSFGQAPSLFFRLGRRPVSSLCLSPLRVYLHLHLRSSDQQLPTQRLAIMSSSEDDTPLVRANGRSAGEFSSLWRHRVLDLRKPSHHPISSHFSLCFVSSTFSLLYHYSTPSDLSRDLRYLYGRENGGYA